MCSVGVEDFVYTLTNNIREDTCVPNDKQSPSSEFQFTNTHLIIIEVKSCVSAVVVELSYLSAFENYELILSNVRAVDEILYKYTESQGAAHHTYAPSRSYSV